MSTDKALATCKFLWDLRCGNTGRGWVEHRSFMQLRFTRNLLKSGYNVKLELTRKQMHTTKPRYPSGFLARTASWNTNGDGLENRCPLRLVRPRVLQDTEHEFKSHPRRHFLLTKLVSKHSYSFRMIRD